MIAPFRVFSGWDRRQAEAAEVFAHSVRANASIDTRIEFVAAGGASVRAATSHAIKRIGVTAFTYARFLVPWVCAYEGRALFCDGCDQLCLGDVRELAEWDMEGKPLWVVKHPPLRGKPHLRARSWTSLMLLDCAQLPLWGPTYVENASDDELMRIKSLGDERIGRLPDAWNVLVDPDGPSVSEDHVAGVKMAHWSHLSDPNGGSWIDRSGSPLWKEWRERWRASTAAA